MMDLAMNSFSEFFSFFSRFITNYITLSFIIFIFGMLSLYWNKDNLIKLLMSFELIVLSTILNFSIGSGLHEDMMPQVFIMLILTIAAAESAIGLAIFFAYFKKKKSVAVKDASLLRG